MARSSNILRASLVLAAGASLSLTGACATEAADTGVGATQQASGFDFGGDCSAGDGVFTEAIPLGATKTVGVIPKGKRNVRIALDSTVDVDVQLVDQETGHEIIAWPNGQLNGANEDCATYENVTYCYSGYNGVDGQLGNEWIEVRGDTNRPLVMRAFGYQSGDAEVGYSWEAVPTCNEKGSGSFSQYIPQGQVTTIGDIPAGKVNVYVKLTASRDLDVQLYDGNTAIVQWPNGLMNGAGVQSVDYQGMKIEWSGYNGTNGNLGDEYIEITGNTTVKLTMKAFGYQAGTAKVDYEWGVGAGETCGGIAWLQCKEGLYCKNFQKDVADGAGSCHAKNWCDPNSVAEDCAIYGANMRLPEGEWACEEFQCTYAVTTDLDYLAANTSEINGQLITVTREASQGPLACTKMGCSINNPCCNKCFGHAVFTANGKDIALNGIDVSGNECTQDVVGNYDLDNGVFLTVQGYVNVDSYGNISIDVLHHRLAADPSCGAPEAYPDHTVVDVVEHPDAFDVGDQIAVTGEVKAGLPMCTLMACGIENPCCNSCGATMLLTGGDGIDLPLEGLHCGGNSCSWQDNCDLPAGATATVWGTVAKDTANNPRLDVADQCVQSLP